MYNLTLSKIYYSNIYTYISYNYKLISNKKNMYHNRYSDYRVYLFNLDLSNLYLQVYHIKFSL